MTAVVRIRRSDCPDWGVVAGRIAHRTGRYFAIVGLDTPAGGRVMIDQPEVGTLAFLVHRPSDGPGSVLIDHKAEPGNVGIVQIAPTLQATASNIDRVHGGRAPSLLDEALLPDGRVADVLGSEQADRFRDKVNRNLVRLVGAPSPPPHPTLEWCAIDLLRRRLLEDFAVNTDARSVLVSGPWGLVAADPGGPFGAAHRLLGPLGRTASASWADVSEQRLRAAVSALEDAAPSGVGAEVPIEDLGGHVLDAEGVRRADGRRVVGWYRVDLPGREVPRWCQPLLEADPEVTVHRLRLAEVDGVLMAGLRPTSGPGWARAEFGPTLVVPERRSVASRAGDRVVLRVRQSDEGGRFNRSVAVYEVAVTERPDRRDGVVWCTLGEVQRLATRDRTLTNELRSCLSLLLACA